MRREYAAGRHARPAGARAPAVESESPAHVASLVSDPRLVAERRGQLVRAAVKLFSAQGYYTRSEERRVG